MNYNNLIINIVKESQKKDKIIQFIIGEILKEVALYIDNSKKISIEIPDMEDHFDADYYLFKYKNKTYDLYSYWKKQDQVRKKGNEAAEELYINTKESFNLDNYKKRLDEFIQLGDQLKDMGFEVTLHYDKDVKNHSLENKPSGWWINIDLTI